MVFPSLMNELLKPDWFGGTENGVGGSPAVNIKESETGYELEMAVPGRKKSDFKIEIDNNLLSVSTEVQKEEVSEKESYTRREFRFASFKRAFALPETISNDKIEASYEDGILTFNLPKKEEALPKPKRMIELS